MIEAGMYIALGFFAATLLALAIVPSLYRRAVRLTREAMQAVNPSSYAEVRAVQDFERVNHALELRKVETALEREREDSTRHRAETGRLQAELTQMRQALEEALKKLERRKQRAEAKGKTTAKDASGEDDIALNDLEALQEKLGETEQALASTAAELDLLKARSNETVVNWKPADDTMALATITGLESQIATLQAKLSRYEHGHPVEADGPVVETDELIETRAWANQLEKDLVDAEARYISAQAELARLSLQIDPDQPAADEQHATLERDLKWAENETARLTALVRDRERALERTGAKLQRLRQDLRKAPALAELRGDLLALSNAILSGSTSMTDISKPLEASQAQKPEAKALGTAGGLLGRILKSSLRNSKATPSSTETSGDNDYDTLPALPPLSTDATLVERPQDTPAPQNVSQAPAQNSDPSTPESVSQTETATDPFASLDNAMNEVEKSTKAMIAPDTAHDSAHTAPTESDSDDAKAEDSNKQNVA